MDVLSSPEISREIVSLMENANKSLLLVTPYFDGWDRFAIAIKDAVLKRHVAVVLLVRGGDDRARQEATTRELAAIGVRVEFLRRLHAKVYINESQAILTSMNLLKSSANDSWEIALRARAGRDTDAYREVLQHAYSLVRRAENDADISAKRRSPPADARVQETPRVAPSSHTPERPRSVFHRMLDEFVRIVTLAEHREKAAGHARPRCGSCIRCRAPVPFDLDQPFCLECRGIWMKFKNHKHRENFCHACGDKSETSAARPRCRPCYAARDRQRAVASGIA